MDGIGDRMRSIRARVTETEDRSIDRHSRRAEGAGAQEQAVSLRQRIVRLPTVNPGVISVATEPRTASANRPPAVGSRLELSHRRSSDGRRPPNSSGNLCGTESRALVHMSTLPPWIEDRIDPEPSRALTQRRVVEAMLTADRPFFLGSPAPRANRAGRQRGTGPESTRGTPRTRRRRRRDGSGGDDSLLYRPSERGRTAPPGRTAGSVAGEPTRSTLGEGLPVAPRAGRDRDARPRGLSAQSGVVHARDRPGRRRSRGTDSQRPRPLDRRAESALALCRDSARRTNRAPTPLAARRFLTRVHAADASNACPLREGSQSLVQSVTTRFAGAKPRLAPAKSIWGFNLSPVDCSFNDGDPPDVDR